MCCVVQQAEKANRDDECQVCTIAAQTSRHEKWLRAAETTANESITALFGLRQTNKKTN